MNIEEVLNETGKAQNESNLCNGETGYIAWHGDVLYWFDRKSGIRRHQVTHKEIFDSYQPYHEEKEIRPENAGELWKNNVNINWFIRWVGSSRCKGFQAVSEQGVCCDVKGLDMVHGKGWTRLFPPIEEDVERIEIEGITFGLEGGDRRVFIREWDKIKDINMLITTPMKMILEMPKDKS